jgi:hypothetical protein
VFGITACFYYEDIVRKLLINSNELYNAFFWLNAISPLIMIIFTVRIYVEKKDLVSIDENNNMIKKKE